MLVLLAGMLFVPNAAASASELRLDLPGGASSDVSMSGFSAWVPDAGVATWCDQGCRDSAMLSLGPGGTGVVRTSPRVTATFSMPSSNVVAASTAGECTIDVTGRTEDVLEGRLSCRNLVSATTGKPVSFHGVFRASAQNSPDASAPTPFPGVPSPVLGAPVGATAKHDLVLPPGAERIRSYDSSITVRPDGSFAVQEKIDYDFGSTWHHGIDRIIPTSFAYDDVYDRVTPIDVTSVTASNGPSADYEVSDYGGGQVRIRIGDPDVTISGDHLYTIDYTIEGAINGFADHDELYWNAVGSEWDVPVLHATAEVAVPSSVTGAVCFAGAEGSRTGCTKVTTAGTSVRFAQNGLYANEGLTTVVGFEKGAIPEPAPILRERWNFQRAFAVTPGTVVGGGGILVLLLTAFGLLLWRNGRDRRFVGGAVAQAYGNESGAEQAVPLGQGGTMPVEFEPPEGIRPGQVGTLIDEAANPLDVSATIVDLAVRGLLKIEEIPKEGLFGKADWTFTRLSGSEGLLVYEQTLLDGLFESGDVVKLSELKTKFAAQLTKVQDALYDDAAARKWFAGRPDKVRGRWHGAGWGLFALGVGLVWVAARWTHLGLIALAIPIAGLVFAFGARWMPRRAPAGTAMVGRVLGFKRFIESPTQEGIAKLNERENVFSEFLPYAIVFGIADKWAKVAQQLGLPSAANDWYVSPHPFVFADFSHAMDSFAVTASGTVAATPASSGSSGGGGFSGGGFGGGGGGSW